MSKNIRHREQLKRFEEFIEQVRDYVLKNLGKDAKDSTPQEIEKAYNTPIDIALNSLFLNDYVANSGASKDKIYEYYEVLKIIGLLETLKEVKGRPNKFKAVYPKILHNRYRVVFPDLNEKAKVEARRKIDMEQAKKILER